MSGKVIQMFTMVGRNEPCPFLKAETFHIKKYTRQKKICCTDKGNFTCDGVI